MNAGNIIPCLTALVAVFYFDDHFVMSLVFCIVVTIVYTFLAKWLRIL